MKDLIDLSYYEILEVGREATPLEIRQAYSEALAVYNEDSIVTYSLFSVDQRREILAAIEKAYTVLSDRKKRLEYDQRFLDPASQASSEGVSQVECKPIGPVRSKAKPDADVRQTLKALAQTASVKRVIDAIEGSDQISGRQLAELRQALGLDYPHVYELIRMSTAVITALENDDAPALPCGVYLKGFLKAYAEVLQLDPERLVNAYLKNLNQQASLSSA